MDPNNQEVVTIEYKNTEFKFLVASASDHIAKTISSTGTFYEHEMLDSLLALLSPGDLVIDAGANIGNHTLYFSRVARCRVHAFEAYPPTAALLKKNVEVNGGGEAVTVHAVALGATKSTASVDSFDPENVGATSLVLDGEGNISVLALDDFEDLSGVKMIKVDVEGMDLAVLKGAQGILQRDRPLVVCEAATQDAYSKVYGFMRRFDYMPAAVYNATDTYLFVPSGSSNELKRALERCFQQVITLQRAERRVEALQSQSGRYSKRLQQEAIAEVKERFSALERYSEQLRDESLSQIGLLKKERLMESEAATSLFHKVDELREGWSQLSETLREDANSALESWQLEKRVIMSELADARTTRDAYSAEAAELQQKLLSLTSLLEGSKHAQEQLKVELDKSTSMYREHLDEAKSTIDSFRVERLDKDRRIKSAHRVLRAQGKELDVLRKQLKRLKSELGVIENRSALVQEELSSVYSSVTFRLGRLLIESLQSPLDAILLPIRIPFFLFRAWRTRRLS